MITKRRALPAAGGIVALVIAVAPVSAVTRSVSIRDDFFSPSSITANLGDTVRWTNGGDNDHTSTADLGLWNSGELESGESYPKTFTAAGAFRYVCLLHDDMVGTVRVPLRVAPTTGTRRTTFTITVATATLPRGFQAVVQVKRPGRTTWDTLQATTARSITFRPSATGTHQFRSKLQQTSGSRRSTGYSPTKSITVD